MFCGIQIGVLTKLNAQYVKINYIYQKFAYIYSIEDLFIFFNLIYAIRNNLDKL